MLANEYSYFLPTFLCRLADPSVKTVMLCGCGGGFDFVHSLLLYPELKRLGKSVVIGSYSFGNPNNITGDVETIFDQGGAVAKRVTGASEPDPYYGPEVHVCSWIAWTTFTKTRAFVRFSPVQWLRPSRVGMAGTWSLRLLRDE
jgi:hypothetical protein